MGGFDSRRSDKTCQHVCKYTRKAGEQIFAGLVIVLVFVYESMKDVTDEEVASMLINRAYIIAMKEIDKERNM